MSDLPTRHGKLAEGLILLRFLAASRAGRTITEMRQELGGCGRRKIERLMRAIESVCGLLDEVESPDREKRWRLPPTPIIHIGGPTAEEMAELDLSARTLADQGLPHRAALLRAAAMKLAARASEKSLRRAEADAEALLAAEGIAMRPGPRVAVVAGRVEAIREAVLASHILEVRYRDAAGRARLRLLEPCGLVYGVRPYLLAAVPGKPDTAVWRLDRIEAWHVTDQSFQPRFQLAEQMRDCFGVGRDAVMDVVLRFKAAAANDARDWHFHSSQQMEVEEDGALLVRLRACGLVELTNHLAIWDDAVEVIEPPQLREALQSLGRRLAWQHQPTRVRRPVRTAKRRTANLDAEPTIR
jgi:predicted DNA-binding transcriptional regulator YafY